MHKVKVNDRKRKKDTMNFVEKQGLLQRFWDITSFPNKYKIITIFVLMQTKYNNQIWHRDDALIQFAFCLFPITFIQYPLSIACNEIDLKETQLECHQQFDSDPYLRMKFHNLKFKYVLCILLMFLNCIVCLDCPTNIQWNVDFLYSLDVNLLSVILIPQYLMPLCNGNAYNTIFSIFTTEALLHT